jgi:putative nucleotidyltransferase with HDIG domain
MRTIETLALAIEAKDQTTGEHLQRVQTYAIEVGKELGLSATELEALRAASVLHDIGKLAVPEYIISKPGKLTPEEFEKMKIHPVVGAEIIEQVQFPYPVAPIVRAHHEKWDGSGYPAGLRGEEIPIGARILSAVDCLDALATDRQYRRALPLDEAIGIVVKESGKAFDAKVVEILERRYQELEQMAKQAGEVSHLPKAKLSVDLKIERGNAPDAGFESEGKSAATDQELIDLAKHLAEASGIEATLPALAERLKRAVPYDALAVYVRRENQLAPAYVSGEDFRLFSSLEIPVGQGLSGWVAENRKPIVNGNPSVEPGYLNDPSRFSRLRSALAAPLELQGRLVGVLALYHGGKDAFTREHLRAVEAIAPRLAAAIEETARPAVAGRKVA